MVLNNPNLNLPVHIKSFCSCFVMRIVAANQILKVAISEQQYGFVPTRSTTDEVFALRM